MHVVAVSQLSPITLGRTLVCLQCWCHRSYPLPTMPSPQPRAMSLQPHGCEPGPPATAAAKHDKPTPASTQTTREGAEAQACAAGHGAATQRANGSRAVDGSAHATQAALTTPNHKRANPRSIAVQQHTRDRLASKACAAATTAPAERPPLHPEHLDIRNETGDRFKLSPRSPERKLHAAARETARPLRLHRPGPVKHPQKS